MSKDVVLDMPAALTAVYPSDEPNRFELPKVLHEDLCRYSRDGTSKFAEAHWLLKEQRQERCMPLPFAQLSDVENDLRLQMSAG